MSSKDAAKGQSGMGWRIVADEQGPQSPYKIADKTGHVVCKFMAGRANHPAVTRLLATAPELFTLLIQSSCIAADDTDANAWQQARRKALEYICDGKADNV